MMTLANMRANSVRLFAGVLLLLSFAAPVAALTDAEYVAAERKRAETGDPFGEYFLGLAYEQGRGVPQNYAKATKWYRLAAEQGFPNAQFHLGLLYYTGRGVPRNFVYAYMWFNLAAARGYKFAEPFRDKVQRQMTPAQIAKSQRLASEWKQKNER